MPGIVLSGWVIGGWSGLFFTFTRAVEKLFHFIHLGLVTGCLRTGFVGGVGIIIQRALVIVVIVQNFGVFNSFRKCIQAVLKIFHHLSAVVIFFKFVPIQIGYRKVGRVAAVVPYFVHQQFVLLIHTAIGTAFFSGKGYRKHCECIL